MHGSELMSVPAVLELGLLSISLRVVRVNLVQGLLFCVQKPGSFLQPEKLEDDVHEVEPAGGLQKPPSVQCQRFSDNRKGDRRWNDVMNAQIIQLFGWEIGEHTENLPAFEFQ